LRNPDPGKIRKTIEDLKAGNPLLRSSTPLTTLFASEQPQTIYNIFNGLGLIPAMADSVLYRLINGKYEFL
jgi:hypothetical protein